MPVTYAYDASRPYYSRVIIHAQDACEPEMSRKGKRDRAIHGNLMTVNM